MISANSQMIAAAKVLDWCNEVANDGIHLAKQTP